MRNEHLHSPGTAAPAKAAQHTPGPWQVVDQHPNRSCLQVLSEYREVAVLYGVDGDKDLNDVWRNDHMRMANARLIAAAPDLLAIAETLVAVSELVGAEDIVAKTSSLVTDARAAIAKATGPSASLKKDARHE